MFLIKFESVTHLLAVTALGLAAINAPAQTVDQLDLREYDGQVVVLDFWASWCVPCRRSFPWLNSMHEKYSAQGLVIIGVNLDASKEDALKFLTEYPASFRIHYDTKAMLARKYGVEAMPSSYVLGKDGEIRARHLGFKVKRQDEYEAIVVEALGEQR
jgi:thiol-disulfide isomerase/thioredoxin